MSTDTFKFRCEQGRLFTLTVSDKDDYYRLQMVGQDFDYAHVTGDIGFWSGWHQFSAKCPQIPLVVYAADWGRNEVAEWEADKADQPEYEDWWEGEE